MECIHCYEQMLYKCTIRASESDVAEYFCTECNKYVYMEVN